MTAHGQRGCRKLVIRRPDLHQLCRVDGRSDIGFGPLAIGRQPCHPASRGAPRQPSDSCPLRLKVLGGWCDSW